MSKLAALFAALVVLGFGFALKLASPRSKPARRIAHQVARAPRRRAVRS